MLPYYLWGAPVWQKNRSHRLYKFLREWFGSHRQWLRDFKAIEAELKQAGFRSIRRCELGDSIDPAFSAVEDPSRWIGCLGAECIR